MWEYATNAWKAVKKYKTEIAVGAAVLTMPVINGCAEAWQDAYQNMRLDNSPARRVKPIPWSNVVEEMMVIGNNESYMKYRLADGTELIKKDDGYFQRHIPTGEIQVFKFVNNSYERTLYYIGSNWDYPRMSNQQSRDVIIIGNDSSLGDTHEIDRIGREAERDRRRIDATSMGILYQMELERKMRELKRQQELKRQK